MIFPALLIRGEERLKIKKISRKDTLYILELGEEMYVTDKNDYFHVGKQPSTAYSC